MVLLPCLLWSSSAVKDSRRTPPAWYAGTRPKVEARKRVRLDSLSGIMPVDKGCLTVRV